MRPRSSPSPALLSCHQGRQRGVTLVEMMVAVVILSIGLLGIAGLQAATSKYKINTWARSAVSTLVSDLSERIRVNPDVAGGNFVIGIPDTETPSQYQMADDWNTQQSADLKAALASAKKCDSAETACTARERVVYDLAAWRSKVREQLPQGAALISGGRNSGFNVTMMWFDQDLRKWDADTKDLQKAPVCAGDETGMARQSCCPTAAAAPAGVRCARISFVP